MLLPWARTRTAESAVKLHTLLDVGGPIPAMVAISDGTQADVKVLNELMPEPGTFYVMDRGYLDFERRYRFVVAGASYVTRTKGGVLPNRLQSRPVDRSGDPKRSHRLVPQVRVFADNPPKLD